MNASNWSNTTSSHSQQQQQQQQLINLTQKLNIIYPIVLSVLTTIGNGLAFLVFTSATFKNSSSIFFLKYKSLADIVNVYIGTLRFTFTGLTGRDLKDTGPFFCYFLNFGVYEMDSVCSWLSVLASLDRLFLVLKPTHYTSLTTGGSRRVHVVSLCTTLSVLTGINLFKNIATFYDWTSLPYARCTVASSAAFDTISLIVTVVVPFVIMIFSSSVIGHSLICGKHKILKRAGAATNLKNEDKSKSFVKTVLCLDACFLVFNTPRFIMQLIKSNTLTYVLVLQIGTILKYSYYALTIVFYAATNSLFRVKLMRIFTSLITFFLCCCCCFCKTYANRRGQVRPTRMSS